MLDGIINIYKEKGYTSHDVVAKLRRITGQKKIGHTGTLDPDAEGVLPVCLGKATKLCEYITDKDKEYIARVKLGVTTDTLDMSGNILSESKFTGNVSDIEKACESFSGDIMQIPPMYSAVKVNGEKLYKLAREGKTIERKPRQIEIYSAELCGYDEQQGYYIDVSCSKGTYIRTLCSDIGDYLGVGACMTSLRRTASNGFYEKDAHSLDEVISFAEKGSLSDIAVDSEIPFMDLNEVFLPSDGAKYYLNGGIIGSTRVKEEMSIGAQYRVKSPDGCFLGLGVCTELGLKSIWLRYR